MGWKGGKERGGCVILVPHNMQWKCSTRQSFTIYGMMFLKENSGCTACKIPPPETWSE